MNNGKDWNYPVMVICKRTGKVYTVASTKEALDMLLNAWPVNTCDDRGVTAPKPIIERMASVATLAMVLWCRLEHGMAPAAILLDRGDFDRNTGFHRSGEEGDRSLGSNVGAP